MLNPVVVWLIKQLTPYVIKYLAKRMGFDDAESHVLEALQNAKPLPPDPLPSPVAQRKPKQYTGW